MNKLVLVFLFGMMFVSSVSALDFDNIKEFQKTEQQKYGEVTIKNLFGLGQDISKFELLEVHSSVIEGSQLYKVTLYKETNIYQELKTYSSIGKETGIKQLIVSITQEKDINYNEPIYSESCTTSNNKSMSCQSIIVGYENKIRRDNISSEYKGEVLSEGVYYVEIQGKRKPNERIDLVLKSEGIELKEFAWWDNSWVKKKLIAINTTNATSVNNVSILYNVTYTNNMTANFSDIRFLDAEEDEELGYWFYNNTIASGSSVQVWIRMNRNISANANTTIYMYYNKSGVSTTSNVQKAGLFGDDFNGTAVNFNTMWRSSSTASYTAGGGILNMSAIAAVFNNLMNSNYTISNYILESRMATNNVAGALNGFMEVNPTILTSARSEGTATRASGFYNVIGGTEQDVAGAASDIFYRMQIINPSAGTAYSNISSDALTQLSMLSGTPTSRTGYVGLFSYSVDSRVDWVFARQFYNPSNLIITTGAEENLPSVSSTQILPIQNYNSSVSNVYFNITQLATGSLTLLNSSIYVYNSSGFLLTQTTSLTGNTNETIYNISFAEGNYTWASDAVGSDNSRSTTGNRTFRVDFTAPVITITYPTNQVPYHIRNRNLTINWTVTDNTATQYCSYQYAGSNNTIACQVNTSSFNTTSVNNRDVIFYANDTIGNQASSRRYWNYSIFEQNNSWNKNSSAFASENFAINITWDNNAYSNIVGYLRYNNTLYLADSSGTGANLIFTRTLEMPSVSGSTIGNFFNWSFELTNATGTANIVTETNLQTVGNISIDDCSTFSNLIVNFTMYDEDSRAKLVPPTVNTSVDLYLQISNTAQTGNVNISFNKTNVNGVKVCVQTPLGGTYRLDSTVFYSAQDRVGEYYNIQAYSLSNSTARQEISLYDLNTTRSQEFKINFLDSNLLPVSDALVKIERQYLSLGTFLTVEIPKTDTDGKTIGHFVLSDVVYRITVIKENQVLAVYNNVQAICNNIATGDCELNLREASEIQPPNSFQNNGGITASSSWNNNTKIYQFTYANLAGTSYNISMNISKWDNFGNQTTCYINSSAVAATMTCNLNGQPIGQYIVKIKNDTAQLYIQYISISVNQASDPIKYFFAFLIIATLPFLAVTSGAIALIVFILGFIASTMLYMLNVDSYIGSTSFLMWLFVACGVLIWKAFSGRNP